MIREVHRGISLVMHTNVLKEPSSKPLLPILTYLDHSVPARITRSGHQIELKFQAHYYKDAWVELDRLIEDV